MKKFSVFLPVLVASFFLLLPNVKAASRDYELTSSMIDDLQYLDTMISTIESNNFTNYTIFRNGNEIWFMDSIRQSWCNGSTCSLLSNGSSTIAYVFSSDFLSYRQYGYSYAIPFDLSHYIIYSIPNIYFQSDTGYTLNFSYFDSVYSVYADSSSWFPSVYELNSILNSNPSSTDNTPILSNFYSVVGSKVGWLGEQIVSNYIYLSIIGVFILIFIIELIRRYFL